MKKLPDAIIDKLYERRGTFEVKLKGTNVSMQGQFIIENPGSVLKEINTFRANMKKPIKVRYKTTKGPYIKLFPY